jgi:hypothetical protein
MVCGLWLIPSGYSGSRLFKQRYVVLSLVSQRLGWWKGSSLGRLAAVADEAEEGKCKHEKSDRGADCDNDDILLRETLSVVVVSGVESGRFRDEH